MSSFQFRADNGIFAMPLEKPPPGGRHTSVNTRSGSQLKMNFKNCGRNMGQVHVIMHFDCILKVSAAGCELLD